MAFVRKKGKSYYLVHNVREEGHVRQVHLACLGNRPRVSDDVLDQVRLAHPQLQIDWNSVRARAAETFVSPFVEPEGVAMLRQAIRTLQQDLADLNWDTLSQRMRERGATEAGDDAVRALRQDMEALRSQLDAKVKHPPQSAGLHSEASHGDRDRDRDDAACD